jgi:hypothetical protein
MNSNSWELAHEYGQGCEVFVDRGSIRSQGNRVRVNIKHHLVPPGTDNRNQKPVHEILFDKEFDLKEQQTCYHSLIFTYTDGSVAEPMLCEPEWVAADKGTLAELNCVRAIVSPGKKRWWLF